jgi:hypothetical protein
VADPHVRLDPPEPARERLARDGPHGKRGETPAAGVREEPVADLDHAPHRVEVAEREAAGQRSVRRVLEHVRDEDAARPQLGDLLAHDRAQHLVREHRHPVLAPDAGVAKRRPDDGDVPLLDLARDEGAVDLEPVRDREDGERPPYGTAGLLHASNLQDLKPSPPGADRRGVTGVQIELSEFLRWLEPPAPGPAPHAELDERDLQRLLHAQAGAFVARRPSAAHPKVQTRRARP